MRGGALSLFSGAGGFDLGARIAGLPVRLATDVNRGALDTLESAGLAEWLLDGDIDDLVGSGDLREAWGKGSPRIIFGGPPCTGFSHAGFWLDEKRNGKDPAVHQIQRYLDVVAEFRPEAFVIENVPGLAFKTHKRHLQGLLNRAKRLGYRVSAQILNARISEYRRQEDGYSSLAANPFGWTCLRGHLFLFEQHPGPSSRLRTQRFRSRTRNCEAAMRSYYVGFRQATITSISQNEVPERISSSTEVAIGHFFSS